MAPPQRSGGRSRNCTRQRAKGGKGRGLNDVHTLNEMTDKEYSSPDFGDGRGGKHDPTTPDGSTPRRKHKCTPRTSMGPPSGVQQPTDWAPPQWPGPLLCSLLAVLAPLTTELILR